MGVQWLISGHHMLHWTWLSETLMVTPRAVHYMGGGGVHGLNCCLPSAGERWTMHGRLCQQMSDSNTYNQQSSMREEGGEKLTTQVSTLWQKSIRESKCACVSQCIYVYVNVCICLRVCVLRWIYVCLNVCICFCMCITVFMCVNVCIWVCACVTVCTCVWMFIYMYMYIYVLYVLSFVQIQVPCKCIHIHVPGHEPLSFNKSCILPWCNHLSI